MWITLLGTFLPVAITTIEKIVGGKSGPMKEKASNEKLTAVINAAFSFLSSMVNAKIIDKTPPVEEVQKVVEAMLQTLKYGGEIPSSGNNAPVPQLPFALGKYVVSIEKA